MEWKSLFIGLLIGVLAAVPLGLAHTGGFNVSREDKSAHWGFGSMGGYVHGPAAHGMVGDMDDHEEMEAYMEGGNFTEVHEEMEQAMEEHMSAAWEERHEYCERVMGIEEDG